VTWGIFEPDSGVLMARRAVQRVVQATLTSGADYVPEAVAPLTGPTFRARLDSLTTRSGRSLRAVSFIFACGPWLPKLFPDLLQDRIHPRRQMEGGPVEPRFTLATKGTVQQRAVF
jgi:sarcosine oxidase